VIEGKKHRTTALITVCLCVGTSVHLGNLRAWRKDSKCVPPEGGDHPGLQRLQLPCEERGTGSSFRALGIAVRWWPTLHRIQDEDLVAP